MTFYNKWGEVYQLMSELGAAMDKLRAQKGGFWSEKLQTKSAIVGLKFAVGNALLPAFTELYRAGALFIKQRETRE